MPSPLHPPASFQVSSAEGWLGLGNPEEAQRELDQIPAALQEHPEVLKARWEICAAKKAWEPSLGIAASLMRVAPEDPVGWVHQSYALHELRRTAEARDHLLGVVRKFPLNATIRYNLACYECRLGHLDPARRWLKQAFALGDRAQMKQVARQDPDLEPLRGEMDQM